MGTWVLYTVGDVTISENVSITTVARRQVTTTITLNPIGGRIFYVDSTASGKTYHFFDSNNNELTTQTVSGLSRAVKYTVTGTSSKDKFYAYYSSSSGECYISSTSSDFGPTGMSHFSLPDCPNGIGNGKSNSASCISKFGQDTGNPTWAWIITQRKNNSNGCNDWYMGTRAELEKLMTNSSSAKDVFNSYDIWSCTTASGSKVYLYDGTNESLKRWITSEVSASATSFTPARTVAIRSF